MGQLPQMTRIKMDVGTKEAKEWLIFLIKGIQGCIFWYIKLIIKGYDK